MRREEKKEKKSENILRVNEKQRKKESARRIKAYF